VSFASKKLGARVRQSGPNQTILVEVAIVSNMLRLRLYAVRYVDDFWYFSMAYFLTMISLLPLTITIYGPFFIFALLFIFFFGYIQLFVFTVLTAIFNKRRYKFSIYFLAIGSNFFAFHSVLVPTENVYEPDGPNINLLVFAQVMLLFAIFYLLLAPKGRTKSADFDVATGDPQRDSMLPIERGESRNVG
jgi:hypothetical protein